MEAAKDGEIRLIISSQPTRAQLLATSGVNPFRIGKGIL
jgi:hypothetical protein